MSSTAADQNRVKQWFAELAGGSRGWIRTTIAAGAFAGLATIAQMVLLAQVIHLGVVEGVPAGELAPHFTGLILAIVLRAIGQGCQAQFAAHCSSRVRRDARRKIHKHWLAAGPIELSQSSAGTLAREWMDHVDALDGYFGRFLPQLTLALILPLTILVLVFWLDWLAGVFLLLSAPLIPLFMALVGMGAEKLNQQHFETISRLSGQFLDKVRGLTTLQLFGQTAGATELIRTRSDLFRRTTMKTLRVAFLSSAVLEFFASVAIAVLAIYIGFGLLGYITYGPSENLTLFSGLLILLLAPEFFQPLRTLSQHYHDRAAALGAGAELLERLDQSANAPIPTNNEKTDTPNTLIELTSVSKAFTKDRQVLKDLSLSIPHGEVIALTGPSGGGKSTLLHLLAGFMAPDSGRVQVFGQPPGSVPFGWLGQKGFLVHGSWADNLRLTTPEATDIAIETALHRVGLGPAMEDRQDGIYSAVSEDGQGLSGGQARRLSLARIFVANYDLILLDEPTAGLDSDSEIYVLGALQRLASEGKTLIFSTHHQALLTLADRALMVANGEVQDA